MLGNMVLGALIEWLEMQDSYAIISDGFGSPHSDRGSYDELAFDPAGQTTFGEMLNHARSAQGATFTGWKGGEYEMGDFTSVYIGAYGSCGEEITETHFKYWLLTAEKNATA